LRRHFALVQQETFLFNDSILDNIRYGHGEATMEQVTIAAKAANAHEFIAQLPSGYDTKVGERGIRLSGGQKQRISIARAFLANPTILLLDEPTSSVEPDSEAAIIAALDRLMVNRTTVLTSHRPSLINQATSYTSSRPAGLPSRAHPRNLPPMADGSRDSCDPRPIRIRRGGRDLMKFNQFIGVDFSGAREAGKTIWIARTSIVSGGPQGAGCSTSTNPQLELPAAIANIRVIATKAASARDHSSLSAPPDTLLAGGASMPSSPMDFVSRGKVTASSRIRSSSRRQERITSSRSGRARLIRDRSIRRWKS